jgi:hypothetical protein
MISIESVLPIFEAIDGADLSSRTFSAVCATSGWGEPVNDGIGLWEMQDPKYLSFLKNRAKDIETPKKGWR